jgi:hypothetical protein
MGHDAAGGFPSNVSLRPQDLERLEDIQNRYYELLDKEDGDLDFFVDGVRQEEGSRVTGVGALHHNADRNVADDSVDYDHD